MYVRCRDGGGGSVSLMFHHSSLLFVSYSCVDVSAVDVRIGT